MQLGQMKQNFLRVNNSISTMITISPKIFIEAPKQYIEKKVVFKNVEYAS